MHPRYLAYYTTEAGQGAVAATEQGVCQVWLPGDEPTFTALAEAGESALCSAAARQLEQYFQRRLHQFDLPVDISGMTPFQRKVLETTCLIPYGCLITYKALAVQVGSPKAARAVGGALGANPVPIIIPCHRVISASGALTGYSATGGISMKKNLLILEGADIRSVKKTF